MAKGIQHITDNDKAAVMDAFHRWERNRLGVAKEDIRFLFTKYHEYVYKSPRDMGCPSCVQYIFNYWQQQIGQWQPQQTMN
ncbi:MAG: hypothetical protein SFW35_00890 [Chitinophagales bacterium]|nr:hypothetical protein [Chitinophagales bacterium]